MRKNPLFPLLLLTIHHLSAQNVWHVNLNATGNQTGADWEHALTNLQTALDAAVYGDEIWVAQGTYYPTDSLDRSISFNLPKGVGLYGGFAGIETDREQRAPQTFTTILSGDIGVTGLRTDNSYHVVTIFQGDDNTVLDGFSIILGYGESASIGFPHEFGGGVLVASDMFWPLATPVISQCRFESNRAGFGGGLACVGNDWTICSPRIKDCVFTGNRGEFFGGGMYKNGANHPQRAFTIERCTFEKNRCAQYGGGIVLYEPSDTVRVVDCKFTRDTAIQYGATMLRSGNQFVHYEFTGCNFTGNYTDSGGSGLAHVFPGYAPAAEINLKVRKCIFRVNHDFVGIGSGIASHALSDLALHRVEVAECLFESNFSQNGGAGILIEGGDRVFTDARVDRCWFLGNRTGANEVAASFYYRGFGSSIIKNQNTITNSVFMHNDGAIVSLGGNPSITHTRAANCSFYNNGPVPFIKYWGVENHPDTLVMTMQILNSVIWEPQTEGVHRLFFNNDPVNFSVQDYRVEHSLVHLSDCEYNGYDPCGEGMIYDTPPGFIDPEFGITLETWFCSPPHNRGSNLVADTFGLTQDYWGNPRIVADTVDLGAYEIAGPCFTNADEIPSQTLPVGLRLLQNPIKSGETFGIELFSPIPFDLRIQIAGLDGRTIWQSSLQTMFSVPQTLQVNTHQWPPGLYTIHLSDPQGRSIRGKVVVW
ncbi:MAG: hypothetical protein SFV22_00085 [Saprospiraceae bacterium]|nr:hypothetical protein [Saprospiraceae bacterium]